MSLVDILIILKFTKVVIYSFQRSSISIKSYTATCEFCWRGFCFKFRAHTAKNLQYIFPIESRFSPQLMFVKSTYNYSFF